MRTNGHGMTLEDWAAAAGYGDILTRLVPATIRAAWRRDEDPSDYRACNPFPYPCARCGNTVQASSQTICGAESKMCARCLSERKEFRRQLPELVEFALLGLDEDQAADIRAKAQDLRVPLAGFKRKLDSLPELVVAAEVIEQ